MKRFLGITLIIIGFSSLAVAEDQYRPLPETLRPWKLAFVRDNNIWVSNGDGTDQKLIIENGETPHGLRISPRSHLCVTIISGWQRPTEANSVLLHRSGRNTTRIISLRFLM